MPSWVEYILAFLLVAGGTFALIGSFGLAKLNDFYMRLHGPTKATTLGLGCILSASAVYFTLTADVVSLHEVLIVVFLFITAPVSAHLLSKTALAERFHFTSDQLNPLDHPLNVGTYQTHDVTGVDDITDPDEGYQREMASEEAAMMEAAHADDDSFDEETLRSAELGEDADAPAAPSENEESDETAQGGEDGEDGDEPADADPEEDADDAAEEAPDAPAEDADAEEDADERIDSESVEDEDEEHADVEDAADKDAADRDA